MGIRGLKTYLDSDPRRFSGPWRWNFPDNANNDAEAVLDHHVDMLVDGMSLLYHIAAMDTDDSTQASPASIACLTTTYLTNLLEALGSNGFLHIFLDGLAPEEKIPSQLTRLQDQALTGEIICIADGSIDGGRSAKALLHLLAEWAFVEAIETMIHKTASAVTEARLFIHRPSHGEAEACIHHWIMDHDERHVVILSNDTDFFVFPSCPGFISFSSLQIQTLDGRLCIFGTQYLRPSLLASFLPINETRGWIINDVMIAVAMFAGCDYALEQEKMDAIAVARRNMVQSKTGGLKQKQKNNPTATAALTAILRFIAFHIRVTQHSANGSVRHAWFLSLAGASHPKHQQLLLEAFHAFRAIYLQPVESLPYSSLDYNPVCVDVRRLLDIGIFFGRPVVESWGRKKRHNQDQDLFTAATVPSAPTTERAVQDWMSRGSVWSVPLFCEIRSRLYIFLGSTAARRKDDVSGLYPHWTSSDSPHQIKEFIRTGTGKSVKLTEKLVLVPQQMNSISTAGLAEDLLNDAAQNDIAYCEQDAVLFCLLGDLKRSNPFLDGASPFGKLLLASFICPTKFALLLLLMGTAPPSIEDALVVSPTTHPSLPLVGLDFQQVFSFLSVACYHANLIATSVALLLGKRNRQDKQPTNPSSDSLSRDVRPSQTFRYKVAHWIWLELQLLQHSEPLISQDLTLATECFENIWANLNKSILQHQNPSDTESLQEITLAWRNAVTPLWSAWCQAFDGDVVRAFNNTRSCS